TRNVGGTEGRFAADARSAEAGTMEGIPERQGLVAPGCDLGDAQCYLDGIRAAGREQHLAEVARGDFTQLLGQLHRRLAGKATRREAQLVELRLDCRDYFRMGITDVMDAVAMEIHVALAGDVLDPNALGFCY